MSIPFFGEVISRKGVQPDPQKVKALMDMLLPNNEKETLFHMKFGQPAHGPT